jgi:hypothetical protein
MPLRRLALAVVVLGVLGASAAFAAGTKPAAEVLPRVQYHLGEIDTLTQHFESVMTSPCPQFASPGEWKSYFDGEVDRVVLLMAHVEQAWREALQTGDDDVRRAAKAPGKRLKEARTLLDKLQQCAGDNGASFSPMSVWKKIEREVPQRQAEIIQPHQEIAQPKPQP